MPILPTASFSPSFPLRSAHFHTIYSSLFRKVSTLPFMPERLELADGDFLDIDWYLAEDNPSDRLAVISHGLEGNSRKKYMRGMTQILTRAGWDVICLNFRGCSGEPNRLPRLYHSGVTDDLHTVLCHALQKHNYQYAALVGFSMGGNQVLKYLGEEPEKVPPQVSGATVFSVPCQLDDAAVTMGKKANVLYMQYFLRGLRKKIRAKARLFPDLFPLEGLNSITTFYPFDDRYTAPVHGFENAQDYYEKSSSKQFIHAIKVPTLLVQSKDDPFLPPSCYPFAEAERNRYFYLETTKFGGH
ncbi:MAG: alpha/beta hydrolase, partial [Deltaproteobacteria bacterium]